MGAGLHIGYYTNGEGPAEWSSRSKTSIRDGRYCWTYGHLSLTASCCDDTHFDSWYIFIHTCI